VRALLLLLLLGLLAACAAPAPTKPAPPPKPPPELPQAVKLGGEIFASDWHVTIIARDTTTLSRAKTEQAHVEAALQEVERQLSLWQHDSELSRFNRTAWTKGPLPVTPGLLSLLRTALQVGKDTDGAFDVTLGPLLDLWGFSPSSKGKVTAPPDAKAIAAAKAKTGPGLLHLADGGVKKDRLDVVVDLTAIGDGAAAAAVLNALVERGFKDVLVDVAGEVVASGQGLEGPWVVGINVPRDDAAPDDVERKVVIDTTAGPRALSTSGTYREAFTSGGKRYPHILDPRTGAPVQHDLVSCSIVAPDVVVADALSTACVVLGVAGTQQVLPRFPGASALFLTARPDGSFAATTTAGFPPPPASSPSSASP
jgi:thiamine biosynthesis lipoprotein